MQSEWFECLICGTESKLRKTKSPPTQLREWQQKFPAKMDEDCLSWIFNLDIKGLDRETCLCRTCSGLLGDLEGYESLARGVRAELLQRHEAGRQGEVLVSDAEPEEEEAAPRLRRSGRRSGGGAARGGGAVRGSGVTQGGAAAQSAAAAPAADPAPARRRGRPRRSSAVPLKAERDTDGAGATPGRRARAAAAAAAAAAVRSGAAAEAAASDGGSDGDVTWADVEMKDRSVEVVLDALDSAGEEGGEVSEVSEEDGDAGSEYAPSPAAVDRGQDDDDSDGGAASEKDNDRDADYQPSPPKQSREFTCSRCGLEFKSRVGLATHERRSHSDENGDNTCAICRKTFSHPGSLTTHQRLVHGKGQRCRHCDEVFRCHYKLYRHLSTVHDIKTYVCEHCGAGFAKQVLLNRHMKQEARKIKHQQRVERLRTLKCSMCDYRPPIKIGKRSGTRNQTAYSMIRDHEHHAHGLHGALTTEPQAAAAAGNGVSAAVPAGGSSSAPAGGSSSAPAAAAGEEELITLTDGGEVAAPLVPEQRHPCAECELVFGCRRALVKHHRTTHKERVEPAEPPLMVQCEYCGKEFSNHYLKIHQEKVHERSNLFYSCQYCGKQYHKYEKVHYISHLQIKHLMVQFPCTEPGCGRTFLHERGLQRHVRSIHQLGWQCSVCQQRFGSHWKRDKHRAEEHGQYDFVCADCGLKFFRRSELEIHTRRVHTLLLKYQCAVCSTRSEERRKLLNHEHSQHGLHAEPLPANNPAGVAAYPCPAAGCALVFGCGVAVKQHASAVHQIRLDIYGKPKKPLMSGRSDAGLVPLSDVTGPPLSDVTGPLLGSSDVTGPLLGGGGQVSLPA